MASGHNWHLNWARTGLGPSDIWNAQGPHFRGLCAHLNGNPYAWVCNAGWPDKGYGVLIWTALLVGPWVFYTLIDAPDPDANFPYGLDVTDEPLP